MNEPAHSNASFSRRMGSIIYDGFLIVALLIDWAILSRLR